MPRDLVLVEELQLFNHELELLLALGMLQLEFFVKMCESLDVEGLDSHLNRSGTPE